MHLHVMNASKASPCEYCGDSPVNHSFHYLESTLSIISSPSRAPKRKRSSLFQLSKSEIVKGISRTLLYLLYLLQIVRFSEDKEKTSTSRTKSIWNEAERQGIRMQEVVVFGVRSEVLRAWLPKAPGSTHNTWQYFESIPIPPWRDQPGLSWVDDKFVLKKEFTKHALPIPKGNSVWNAQGALNVLSEVGGPVIVKPREGSRGRHTTISITDPTELTYAVTRAKQLSPLVLVEEHIPGRVYRATCIGKKVIGIMELVRPIVVADGVKTIAELREYHNAHNKAFPQLTDVEDGSLFRNTIRHQGYTLESVPEKDTAVLLAEFSERTNGGYFVDCTDDVPLQTIQEIERGAEVCGLDLVGFDLISEDLSDATKRFTFIEGNTLPYIEIHDIPYAGPVRNVSAAVFELWKMPA
jgi:D-alanine-D-alanine ligase-like ATP-grasp enzyme